MEKTKQKNMAEYHYFQFYGCVYPQNKKTDTREISILSDNLQ